jgi:hypothetical protein
MLIAFSDGPTPQTQQTEARDENLLFKSWDDTLQQVEDIVLPQFT